MQQFWNERYSSETYAYGTSPNGLVEEQLKGEPPGKLYLPGEGEGRNAVFAAGLGWSVTALDWSEAGKKKTLSLAGDLANAIDYRVEDLTGFTPEPGAYDAVALVFLHLPAEARETVHRRSVEALKPGGLLLLEAFDKEQLKYGAGGPKKEELLYSLQDIAEDFIDLSFTQFEKLHRELDEGEHHRGKASIIQFVGRR